MTSSQRKEIRNARKYCLSALAEKCDHVLSLPGIRVSVILGMLTVLATAATGYMCWYCCLYLLLGASGDPEAEIWELGGIGVAVLLSYPAAQGLRFMTLQAVRKGAADFRDLFAVYMPRNLLRTAPAFLCFLLRWGVAAAACLWWTFFADSLPERAWLFLIPGIAVAAVWLLLTRSWTALTFLSLPGQCRARDTGSAMRALRAERVRLGCYVRLPARSIPALLLSLLTALILAFADTLPKLAVRRALCADGMSDIIRFERKTQSHGTT